MEYKQVILVRKDLKMDKGKIASQASHASVDAVLKSDNKLVNKWRNQGMKKSVLKVKDKKELLMYMELAKKAGLKISLITDSGRTAFHGTTTTTCLAIGPDEEEKIDFISGELKLY